MKNYSFILLLLFSNFIIAQVQPKDKAKYIEYKPGYYQNSILKGIEEFKQKDEVVIPNKSFKIDFTGMDIPTSVEQFTKQWHNEPISQGNTGTCWCFSATSFYESEIFRLTKQTIKLSEMYTVYWEYVEKAKYFVKTRGTSEYSEGSECNAVARIWKTYGIVPLKSYTGMLPGQTFHSHAKMAAEMTTYLQSVKTSNAWNEDQVVATIKSILNSYMGVPPTKISVSGKDMTPLDYFKNVIKVKVNDYVDVMSLMSNPYNTKAEYPVGDNWWHSKDYCNVSLDDFMNVVKSSIKKGYTIAIGGDVSEAGFESLAQTAVIPSFDIPSEYIDENARQFRFNNGSTTDDHGMHIVGYYEKDRKTWFLVKDSGSGSRNAGSESKNFGYYFFHEDFIKLKMMTILVHKDMVKDILSKMQ